MLISDKIPSDNNYNITFDLRYDETNLEKKSLVLISHGYKGFKDWGFIPYLSEVLAKNNYFVANIDFSLNGIIDPVAMTFDPEVFAKNTVSQEIKDLHFLIDYLKLQYQSILNDEIILIGHSLGGAVSIITSSERNDISKLVLLATISSLERNTERQKELWRSKGKIEIKIPSSNQVLWQDVEYLEDKERNKDRFNLLEILSRLNLPTSIIHGEQDFTVPIKEAKALFEAIKYNNSSELKLIPKCNHIFNIKHPFDKVSIQTQEMIDYILNFLISK